MFDWLKRKKEVRKHDKSYPNNIQKLPNTLKRKKGIKYNCRIKYKNHEEEYVTLIMDDVDSLVNAVFNNRISLLTDGKVVYFNSGEILKFVAEEEKENGM